MDSAGENKDACANATHSAGVADPMAAKTYSHGTDTHLEVVLDPLAAGRGSYGGGIGGGVGMSKCHRLVMGLRVPSRIHRWL